ncbi:hypothetical protein [Clostridium felsineum]|uniref:Uncharacterized protein n=1 Tax=Clostridium felsineum TaxID=36839 RepID=A0A1S8L1L6_9CLOT|nr:hypothetical protein [Clostridium felsineum]URZ09233.1 hypothetical protein CLROS_046490 [Clostridium felsineum]URZ13919.1 hypothetical protein CROST_046970 [Clostridium felsineum]URZ18536.1 hypothetical protein CLFE_046240 [Clostridium felsineum DSM 794]
MFDLAITEYGDFILNSINNELCTVDTDALKFQRALCRLKSIKNDWFSYAVGANIEDVVGMPRSKNTLRLIKNKIVKILTFDSLYASHDIYIEMINKVFMGYEMNIYLKNQDEKSSNFIILNIDLIKGMGIKIGGKL